MQPNRETAVALEMLKGFAEGVENSDSLLDAIGAIRLVEIAADKARQAIIKQARSQRIPGMGPAQHSWTEIGDALGTSRQNAQQRFG